MLAPASGASQTGGTPMANNLDTRLRVLEHRTGNAGAGDGLDAVAAWVAGARGRLNPDAGVADVWDWVERLSDLQRQNLRVVAAADPTSFSGRLAAGGYLGDDAKQALAGDDAEHEGG